MPGSWMSLQGTCPGEEQVLTLSSQTISCQSWMGNCSPTPWQGSTQMLSPKLYAGEHVVMRNPKGFPKGNAKAGKSSLRRLDGFIFQHSIIQGTNQDGFIQRAIDASNAYASIIEAVKKAERAAHDANEAASEALMVCAVGSPMKMSKSQTLSTVLQLLTPLRGALLPLPSNT